MACHQYISLCKESCVSRWRFLRFDHISYCSLLQMRKALFLSPLMLIFLAACSPQAYQVNPQPSVSTKPKEIPESQQDGYMRIIGDLRWDKFITRDDWIKRFPDCLYGGKNWVPEFAKNQEVLNGAIKYCSNFIIGGISISPQAVNLSANSGTSSGLMTSSVEFVIKDESQFRAFVAAIKDKYDAVSDDQSETLYCSNYTCWRFEYDTIFATPTPYTVSILDRVKIDSSKF